MLLAACASIAGLDNIQEDACAPHCALLEAGNGGIQDDSGLPGRDASMDSTPAADSPSSADQSVPLDTGVGDDGTTGRTDGTAPVDSSADVGAEAIAPDGNGPADAPQEASPPVDSGCGPTNTVQNCGACGQACASSSTSTSSASCSGTACVYQCNSGYLDCNAGGGFDPDGCECNVTNSKNTPACCDAACPTQHTDGVSGVGFPSTINFYDCNPVGSYSHALAQDACLNLVGSGFPSQCSDHTCQSGDLAVCALNQFQCSCWVYSGTNVGKVAATLGSTCNCPGEGGTTTSWQ